MFFLSFFQASPFVPTAFLRMEKFLRDAGKKEVRGEENFSKNWGECVGIIHLAVVERCDRGEGKDEGRQKIEEKEIQACFKKQSNYETQ